MIEFQEFRVMTISLAHGLADVNINDWNNSKTHARHCCIRSSFSESVL